LKSRIEKARSTGIEKVHKFGLFSRKKTVILPKFNWEKDKTDVKIKDHA